jgi:hypothetical protein
MRQFAGWQAPFYSFWSKSFYIDVAKNWGGVAYAYLFVLLCFTWLFMSTKIEMEFSYKADHVLKPVIEQLPLMTIKKGILSIDRPSPYTIKGADGVAFITFDTRDNPMKPAEAPGIFLVEKNTAIFKPSEADKLLGVESKEPQLYKRANPDQNMDLFSNVDQAVIDQKSVNQVITTFKRSLAIGVFLVALPLGFILCMVQSLLYGLLAMAIASANQINISYGAAVRLSVVAMTPVLLVDSLLKLRNLNSIFWGPIALFITVGYIMFAIRANIDEPSQKSQSTDL